jgi:hypothetical protein
MDLSPAPDPLALYAPSALVGEVEHFLQQALAQLEPDQAEAHRRGPGRPRILPALCLWAGLLVCVLRGFSSHLELWRLLSLRGLWAYPRFPVTDQAVYARLERAGTAPLEACFEQIRQLLAARLAPYADLTLAPFAADVLVLDETALDPLPRKLPALREVPKGDRALWPGTLATLFDVRRQQFRHVRYYPDAQENERRHARALLAEAQPQSLILADLGYFGFEWFDDLTEGGHFFVSRLREKSSYRVLHRFYERGEVLDLLVFLGAYRRDRMKHALRLVQFRVGSTLYRYVTNVLEPHVLPLAEIARLYARRWDVEMAFQLVKEHLGLRRLASAKLTLVLQQVWAVLTLAQILQALRVEIAARCGVELFDVSLPLLVRYLPQFAADGQDPVHAFVERGRAGGLIRPSRRVRLQLPPIASAEVVPRPATLVLTRTPRYGHHNCGRPTK